MECEIGVSRNIIDELDFSDREIDILEGDSGVTRSIIDEFHSWEIQEDQS